MALDDKHHLEGVLIPPGIFRIYLYDAHTHLLSPAEMKNASGKVQWGGSEDSPELPLTLGKDGKTLESVFDRELRFPLTLTLWLHLPGSPPDARPELFTFPFSHYTRDGELSGEAASQH